MKYGNKQLQGERQYMCLKKCRPVDLKEKIFKEKKKKRRILIMLKTNNETKNSTTLSNNTITNYDDTI